jgi:hypothetical protein
MGLGRREWDALLCGLAAGQAGGDPKRETTLADALFEMKGDFSRAFAGEEDGRKTERTIEKCVRKVEDP